MTSPILVTGATGFLGRHVCRELQESGHTVRAIGRSDGADLRAMGVEYVCGSILDDKPLMEATDGVEHAYHLAGWVSRDPKDAEAMRAIHVEGTRRMVEALSASGCRRVVYASSTGTIAASTDPHACADESTPYPLSVVGKWPYYETKIEAEELGFNLARERGLEWIAINPSLILGPGDSGGSSTGDVIQVMRKQIPAIPPGGVSFVDVRDVATGALLAMEKGVPGERYILAAANWSLETFIKQIGVAGGVKTPTLTSPGWLTVNSARIVEPIYRLLGKTPPLDLASAQMSCLYWYADSSKAKTELGFRPRDPMVTLRDTVDDLQQQGLI